MIAVVILNGKDPEVILCADSNEAKEIADFKKSYAYLNDINIEIFITENIYNLV